MAKLPVIKTNLNGMGVSNGRLGHDHDKIELGSPI